MRILFLAATLLVAACGPSPREFPVGIFTVKLPSDAHFLKSQGFNAFQSYEPASGDVVAFARAARREAQLLLIPPYQIMASTLPDRGFSDVVWYLHDEPDVSGMTRDQLAEADHRVKAWAPGATTAFVVGSGNKAKNYPDVADVIMVDWYPVPHLPLESAGDHVRMTAEAAGGRKVWAVLQAFDWRSSIDANPRKIGRLPTRREVRFMSYDSVLNGAVGVWYFSFSTAPSSNISQTTPELFSAVSHTAKELRAMAPIFARGRSIPLPFDPPTRGWMARAWTYRGRDYLVLANRTKDRQWRVPEEALKPYWRPLFEARRDPRELLKSHNGSYYLKPYQVLVLESRLRPKRLLGR